MRKSHSLIVASIAVAASVAGWIACSSTDDTTPPAGSGGAGGSGGSHVDSGTGGSGGSHVDSGTGGTGTGGGGTGGSDGGTTDAGSDVAPSDAGTDGDAGATSCIGSDASYSDADIAAGMNIVLVKNCANCHQVATVDGGLVLSGKTTTIVADAAVFPKNLTPDPETGLGCWTDQQIVNAILNGIDDQDASLCVMPKFAGKLDGGTAAAQQIVAFLRTLTPVHNAIPETECPPPASDAGTDAHADAADAGTDALDAGDGSDAGD